MQSITFIKSFIHLQPGKTAQNHYTNHYIHSRYWSQKYGYGMEWYECAMYQLIFLTKAAHADMRVWVLKQMQSYFLKKCAA